MADRQRIHPVDIESPSAPQASHSFSQSKKHDVTDRCLPLQGTVPVAHAEQAKKKRSCNWCCTILTIVILIILIGATAGILYRIFDPKIPKYSVDRLGILVFDVDNNMVRASFNVTVTARNPNKKIGIYHEGSYPSLWYTDSSLCKGSFPEFYQGHRNMTVRDIIMTGESQLTELQQQAGMIPLLFKGDVRVRVKFGSLKLWKVTFGVGCNLVVNSLSASNQISIKSSSCKFKLKL
ncbi:NDR1/HIN1-like protein 6 [Cocos nucifera]|uniref:NDR1/HIN1-like protein 6 n=1 Tax=Cocos nucifera TaxID=13894 RepID=A0A8K0IJ15_COCNU|nr:NDR1/HIN1-like protein 6 [Cocos nucifera]